MTSISREFQIFAKAVGPLCNLNCSYCYYVGKGKLYPDTTNFIMEDEILEKYILQHIQASTDTCINFSWHGGEPLLAGIDFFRKVVRFQTRYTPPGSTIKNGIQTNGTLLNNKWCSFLASEGFSVGISIDGPGNLHNDFRRTKKNESTLNQVIRGFELLKKYGITPEILCVVNSGNVKHPVIIYDFFKQLGAKYITFLPLVEKQDGTPTGASQRSVPTVEYGVFLSKVFDEWVEKDIGNIKVQIFEEAARTAFNQEHTLCIFRSICGGVPVVDHSGDFYSCDHYVDKDHLLGNINEHPLIYYLDCEEQKKFGQFKSASLPTDCTKCEVRSMCNGECPKNRFMTTSDGEMGLNYLCAGYKFFFTHCRPFVEAIRETFKGQMQG